MTQNPTLTDDLTAMMARNGGSLDLSYTAIAALPEGLTVGGLPPLSEDDRAAMLKRVAEVALAPGNTLDMDSWHRDGICGTTHCIAGWAQHLADEKYRSIKPVGAGLLLLGPVVAQRFFDSTEDGREYLESVLADEVSA